MAQDASEGRLGVITRRMFVGGMAGVGLTSEGLVLEALAAERMPHHLVVHGVEKAPFFELRDYGSAAVAGILERCGIHAVWRENGRFLFAFESLAHRERVWREASADADWRCAELREIAVYKISHAKALSSLRS